MNQRRPTLFDEFDEQEAMRARLAEAEDTLEALRTGRVDALVMSGPDGERVFTLDGAEHPYRVMVEAMQEGALTLATDGTILYCNKSFAAMVGVSMETILGSPISALVEPLYLPAVKRLLVVPGAREEITLSGANGKRLQVHVSANPLDSDGKPGAIYMVAMDLTEHKKGEGALRDAERKYRGIFENALEGIFQMTPEGAYLSANPALARICRYESESRFIADMNEAGISLYVEPGGREQFLRLIRERGEVRDSESQIRCKDGSVIWISENARSVFDAAGTLIRFEGSVEDITARKNSEALLEYQANYDSLTGLKNRHCMQSWLEKSLESAARYGHQVTVAFVDLDRFKFINDSLGHHIGDRMLQAIAGRLQSCLRTGDFVSRHGGDEFVLVIDHSNEAAISRIMPKILESISAPISIDEHELFITCSIGLSLYPIDGSDGATLLRHADSAMYRAKEQGRNNFQFYTQELNARIRDRVAMESNLRHALERNEFFISYQPKVNLATNRIVGVEALIRWKRGDTIISPADFIPLAEEIGLIVPIGEWVLRTACAQNKAWQNASLPPISVSVNLSARQFREKNLLKVVERALHDTGLEARFLDLELTESMVMHNVALTITTLGQLKAMGVTLSIDDFGTGYSSLSSIKRFPLDALKIDQSFVKDITSDAGGDAIAAAIIALGHILQLKVVAEGVETEEQLDRLRHHACDEMQGYLFSRPVSSEAIAAMLRDNP